MSKWKIATSVAAVALSTGLVLVPLADAETWYLAGTRPVGSNDSSVSQAEVNAMGADAAIAYPRTFWPVTGLGSPTLGASVRVGVDGTLAVLATGDKVIGVSQGAVVAEQVKQRKAATDPMGDENLTFVKYADPTNNETGFLAGLNRAGINLGDLVPTMQSDDETPYDTVTVVRQYDFFAHTPNRPIPLAVVNAVAGGIQYHPYYEAEWADAQPGDEGFQVTETTNSAGGTNKRVLVETKELPILKPLRDAGVPEDLVEKIEKPLKRRIDNSYDETRTTPVRDHIKSEVKKSVESVKDRARIFNSYNKTRTTSVREHIRSEVKKSIESVKDRDEAVGKHHHGSSDTTSAQSPRA